MVPGALLEGRSRGETVPPHPCTMAVAELPQGTCFEGGSVEPKAWWGAERVTHIGCPGDRSPPFPFPCLRSSPVVRIKEEPPSPSRSPQIEEASPVNPSAVETPLSPSTFIDSILQENEPSTTTAAASNSTTQPQPPEKCLSVACLDK